GEDGAEDQEPANVVSMQPGEKLEELLAKGELAAAIGIESDHPDVAPLIPDAAEAGFDALRSRGHYPINHLVVVKDEVLAAHPNVAGDVFTAFAESKRRYVDLLRTGGIEAATAADRLHTQ